MSHPSCAVAFGRPRRPWLAAIAMIAAALIQLPVAEGSDTTAGSPGPAGHPRERFPLAVYARPARDAALAKAFRVAVHDWNAVFQATLGAPAFTWREQEEGADVIIRFVPASSVNAGGRITLDVDELGVIRLPVRIDLPEEASGTAGPPPLVQMPEHELGHAVSATP
jgi:hypothetical protein